MTIKDKSNTKQAIEKTRACPHCEEILENVTTSAFAFHLRECPQGKVSLKRKNYMAWRNMKEAITEVISDFNLKLLKPLLWHDKINDVFILTKRMEIYFWSRYILECYCWSHQTYVLLRRKGLILEEQSSNEPFYIFKVSIENLPFLISQGGFKRRPDKEGNWIVTRRHMLGHEIISFKPEVW
ncbi:MAG TPA: hypothetical protein ENH82_08515 [bacterium]|nr:hypothetical protein [bacterium]